MTALRLAAQATIPDLQTLSTSVRTARRASQAGDDVKAQADKLIAEASAAQSAGQPGEARRKLANALAVLNGERWDQKREFAWSLALRASRIAADSSLPFLAHISQLYSASYKPGSALTIRTSLIQSGKTKELGTFDLPSRDLIEQPLGFDAAVEDVADGAYQLKVEVLEGDAPIATLDQSVQLARGIESQASAVQRRLAKIQGHDATKSSVLYPYQLARVVNAGQRQLNQNDFGGPWHPKQLPYDFAQGLRNSAELLKALESGKDPLWRAKGDHERHYWFEEAREPMAYRVYAPTKWDGKTKLPMVLVLHGNSRDQDYYFDRDGGILAKLAEQHGYLVATPMGYRPNGGWGSNNVRGVQTRQSELSERDALHVLDLVTKEYGVDTSRIYLFGHSAGGAGTWYLGQKYPDRFAAIAASAAATTPDGFPFDRLKGMPVMICHGDQDPEVPVARSRNMVKAMKEHGYDPVYLEVPGATHATIVALVEPKVFDFFDRHPRK